MTLRQKTLLFTGVILICLIAAVYLIQQRLLLNGFEIVETDNVNRNVQRVIKALSERGSNLSRSLSDWAIWDDTYVFMQDANPGYVENNLPPQAIYNLGINWMIFVNASGEVIFTRAVDLATGEEVALPASLAGTQPGDDNLRQIVQASPITGIVSLPDQLVIVAAQPVLPTSGQGTPAGTLIWGRSIDEAQVESLAELVGLSVTIQQLGSSPLTNGFAEAQANLSLSSPIWVKARTDSQIEGYGLVEDISGAPAFILQVSQPRPIFAQALTTLTLIGASLLAVGIVSIILLITLLEQTVLKRLAVLSDELRRLAESGNFTAQIEERGSDELSVLTRVVNQLLRAVVQSRTALEESNAQLAGRTQALETKTNELETLLNTMGEGVMFIVDNRIEYLNPALAYMLLYRVSDLTNEPVDRLFGSENSPAFPASVGDTPINRERTLVRRDGSTIRVALVITPLRENAAVILVRDITQEKLAEAQRDLFFERASHELRTPLANITTRLYLLEKDPKKVPEHLAVLTEASRQLRTLIEDIFAVTRIGYDVDLVSLNLYDLVSQVIAAKAPAANEKGINLELTGGFGVYSVWGDAKQLTQAVSQLIDYAVQRSAPGKLVLVSIIRQQGRIVLNIIDQGAPIPESRKAHIFDPFYADETTGFRGNLGLYIARQVVSQHRGEICVEDTPDQGVTTFSLSIPAQPA